MGHNKRKCEHYQNHIRQQRGTAYRLLEIAKAASGVQKRGVANLLAGTAWDDVCKELTNDELADALKHKVWANMKLGTEEISLMEQAIDRLSNLEAHIRSMEK